MKSERLEAVRWRLREEAMSRGASPRDVDLLLSDLTGRSLSWLIAHGDEVIDAEPLEAMLLRRWRGEPLQYIRGRVEFFSREFVVDDRALIPRPETEILVETAIARAKRGARVVDIGTGTGCIAISVERERPDLRVTAVDVSIAALALAHRNRQLHGSRIHLAASDILRSLEVQFDLIVSNPPYIPSADVETLDVDVRDFEPRIALTPGPRGTEIIERILDQSGDADVIFEIGYGQESQLRALADAHRFPAVKFIPDLAGIPRVVVLSRHGE
jgi:release factor glutamine methyltransferase